MMKIWRPNEIELAIFSPFSPYVDPSLREAVLEDTAWSSERKVWAKVHIRNCRTLNSQDQKHSPVDKS